MTGARRSANPTEIDECKAFVDWTRYVRYRGAPLFDRLVKIPNERGKAGVMTAILHRIGMKTGFPDYELLVPLSPHAGLFLEAKRAIGGKVNPEQESWRAALIEFGYQAKICAGADELIGAVRDYMRAAPADDWYDEPLRAPERART